MTRTALLLGAVLVLGAGGCGGDATAGGPETVELVIHHSRFSAEHLQVPLGRAVRFVVRNEDPIDHELIVGDQAVQDRHERGNEAHHGEVPGEVSVPAGTTAATTYVFARPGPVLFGCHIPGHYAYGMRGDVVVG
jgi:uncharacterized cupredoxin-like copper-binding protein